MNSIQINQKKKFIILTTGRTGSSNIVKDIDTFEETKCLGEIFSVSGDIKKTIERMDSYPLRFNPLRLWSYSLLKICSKFQINNQFLKFIIAKMIILFFKIFKNFKFRISLINEFLELSIKNNPNIQYVGFKAILTTDNIDQIFKIASQYKVIFLYRENSLRQVMSSMIAEKRGYYNGKIELKKDEHYTFNKKDVLNRLKYNINFKKTIEEKLKDQKIDHISVSMERWINDKDAFFQTIADYLSIKNKRFANNKTRLKVSNPDVLSNIINNFQEIQTHLKEEGYDYSEGHH